MPSLRNWYSTISCTKFTTGFWKPTTSTSTTHRRGYRLRAAGAYMGSICRSRFCARCTTRTLPGTFGLLPDANPPAACDFAGRRFYGTMPALKYGMTQGSSIQHIRCQSHACLSLHSSNSCPEQGVTGRERRTNTDCGYYRYRRIKRVCRSER